MTRPILAFAFAILGALAALPCMGQERPLLFPDESQVEAYQQQDKKYRRLEARNNRAQRSICEDGCRIKGRPQRTQPADPFAELPSWETNSDPRPPGADE